MDKLVKKEVLTVYISQFAMIAVALFCCIVPLKIIKAPRFIVLR